MQPNNWSTQKVQDLLNLAVKTPVTATLHGFNLIYSGGETVNINPGTRDSEFLPNEYTVQDAAFQLLDGTSSGTHLLGIPGDFQDNSKIVLFYLPGCYYSKKARDLLETCNNRRDLVVFTVEQSTKEYVQTSLQNLGVPTPVTFPQVFWYGALIPGGYSGLKTFLTK